MSISSSHFKLGGLAAAVIMGLTAAVPLLGLSWVNDARVERQQAEDRLVTLRRTTELLVDAESGQRGYVITGKIDFLQPYHAALNALPIELEQMERRYAASPPSEAALVTDLLTNVQKRLDGLAETVALRQSSGFGAAEQVVSSGQGKHYMDEVRRIAAELGTIEAAQLSQLDEQLRSKNWRAINFSLASTALTILLLGYLGLAMWRVMRARELSAREAVRTTQQLEDGMAALRRRNQEVSTLGDMSRVLQTELSAIEALEVTSQFCSRLLVGTTGSIYFYNHAAGVLDRTAQWGEETAVGATLEPTSCWGLRRGQPHHSRGNRGVYCSHCQPAIGGEGVPGEWHLCLPLAAYGEVFGLMTLRSASTVGSHVEEIEQLAQTVSEQTALTLSNVKLRQVLRDQSVRDALTGLYNRRFMSESLQREVARAQREGTELSVLIADLDHFKAVNDTHGHPAGDAVLKAAAQCLADMVRASDIACRYGGEEFVLILPDCSKAAAVTKAEQICAALRCKSIVEGGKQIQVTASLGVAASGVDGNSAEQLIAAADRAVYTAKHTGRDRVVAAATLQTLQAAA